MKMIRGEKRMVELNRLPSGGLPEAYLMLTPVEGDRPKCVAFYYARDGRITPGGRAVFGPFQFSNEAVDILRNYNEFMAADMAQDFLADCKEYLGVEIEIEEVDPPSAMDIIVAVLGGEPDGK